jgi:hypothetical protein
MHWVVILRMNNTLSIIYTKNIPPMVFIKYPQKGIDFFLGLNF